MSDAITRKESLLKSIADGTSSSLKPITREEQYLAYIAGESNSFPTTPITREEAFLDKIAKSGAGNGGSGINVQPLTVTENGTWDAPDGQAYDPVIVNVAGGGGAELNIAYGDTAPEDTSKLWVKTSKPSAVKVSSKLNYANATAGDLNVSVLSATLPHKCRGGAVSEVIDGKVYIFGDTLDTGGAIDCFDISTQTASTLSATFPWSVLNYFAYGTVGSKVYVLGGYGYKGSWNMQTAIYCFDAETETTTTLSFSMPQTVWKMGCATVGGKIYMFGGSDKYSSGSPITTIYCFDVETETLTTLPNVLPYTAYGQSASVNGDTVYLIGGTVGTIRKKDVTAFNVKTGDISVIATFNNLDIACSSMSAVWGDHLYIFGDEAGNICSLGLKDHTYNAVANQNLVEAMGTRGFIKDGVVYVVGTNKILRVDLPRDISLDTDNLQLHSTLEKNTFNIINTDTIKAEIGVNKVYKGNSDGIAEEVEASLHNGTSWVTI